MVKSSSLGSHQLIPECSERGDKCERSAYNSGATPYPNMKAHNGSFMPIGALQQRHRSAHGHHDLTLYLSRAAAASPEGSVLYKSGMEGKEITREVDARRGARCSSPSVRGGSGKTMEWRTESGRRELFRKEASRSNDSMGPLCLSIPFSRSNTWSAGQGNTGSGVAEPGMVPLCGAQKRSNPQAIGGKIRILLSFAARRNAARNYARCRVGECESSRNQRGIQIMERSTSCVPTPKMR